MIIRLTQKELDKFPIPEYEIIINEITQEEEQTMVSDAPFKINILLQDIGHKERTYDIIGKITGDIEVFIASGIIFEELNGDVIIPVGFKIINTPGNIVPKTIDDVAFILENLTQLKNKDVVLMDSAIEFKTKVDITEVKNQLAIPADTDPDLTIDERVSMNSALILEIMELIKNA